MTGGLLAHQLAEVREAVPRLNDVRWELTSICFLTIALAAAFADRILAWEIELPAMT